MFRWRDNGAPPEARRQLEALVEDKIAELGQHLQELRENSDVF